MAFAIDESKLSEAKTFDRGNPPIKTIAHQAFPKMIYNHKASRKGRIVLRTNQLTYDETQIHVPEKIVTKVVQNDEELQAALRDGWELKPPKFGPVEPEEENAQKRK